MHLLEREPRGVMARKVVAGVEAGGGEHGGYGKAEDGGSTENSASSRKPRGQHRGVPRTTTAANPSTRDSRSGGAITTLGETLGDQHTFSPIKDPFRVIGNLLTTHGL